MGGYTAVAPQDGAAGEADAESVAVHAWRVSKLRQLGLAWPVAELVADDVDWHEVAKLVRRGCPAALAVAIVQ
jgi:hypothetical protein